MKAIPHMLAGIVLLAGVAAYAQVPPETDRAGNIVRDTGQAIKDTAKDTADRVTGSRKPAVKSSGDTTPGAPIAGANSFTEAQARSRIQARGYSEIGNLAKDQQGVWHATASKGGQQMHVALDYQGNVVESTAASTGSSSMSPNTIDR